MKKEYEIYTDGACIGNGQKKNVGGWSFVVVRNASIIYESVEVEKNTTNNRQEMKAVIFALDYVLLKKIESFTIFCDSQYVVNGFNDWMHKWEAKGWVRGYPPEPIPNVVLWEELFALKKQFHKVDLRWIRGHNGNWWNEYADELIEKAMADHI